MKLLSCLSIPLFIFICNVQGQELQDIPPYDIVPLKWQHFFYNPKFSPNPNRPERTKYSSQVWQNSIISDDFIYILENTYTTTEGYRGNDGFLLHKVDKNTGERLWVHDHTQNVGVKNFEFSTPYIGINSEGNITILTYRDRDTMPKDKLYFRDFIFTPAVHTIDQHTGQKIDFKYGQDTTKFENTRFSSGTRMHMQKADKYFSLIYRTTSENGLTKDYLDIHQINNNLDIGKEPFYTYKIDTDIPTPYSLGYKPWIQHLYSADTMVVLTGTSKPIGDLKNSPEKAFLRWFDISDQNNFQHLKTIEVTDAFARPQKNLWMYDPRLHFRSNHIFLTQIMVPDTKIPFKNFSWLWWFDADGNILGKFEHVKWLDTFYLNVVPIGVKNGKAYLLANYYATIDDPIETWDILELEPHTNFPKKIGQFLSYRHRNGNFRISHLEPIFLDNGSIYIDNYFKVVKNDIDFFYRHSCCVEEESLGIITSTQEPAVNQTWSWIYPNPTAELLHIQLDEVSTFEVFVRDITGNLVLQKLFEYTSEPWLDMSHLPSGMYSVNIIDRSGRKSAMTFKVVRL